jgi:cytochrome P450
VQGGAELSEDTIAESGISLLLAGTDTSGGGSTAALAMLAQFPHVIQRLREEQQQVSAELMYVLSIIDMDCHTCGLMKTPSTTLVCMALPTP